MAYTPSWKRRKNWPDERLKEHECTRKIPYATWVQANQARIDLETNHDDGKGPMAVYECRWCGQYHVGHRRTAP